MERVPVIVSTNSYVRLKYELSEYITNNYDKERYIHLRLHTLYGGKTLNTNLFLGKLVKSLELGQVFEMSSGRQLRQYHHVDDILKILIGQMEKDRSGVLEIGGLQAMTLREIATLVVSNYGDVSKIKFSPRLDQDSDIYHSLEPAGLILSQRELRDRKSVILRYVKQFLSRKSPNG